MMRTSTWNANANIKHNVNVNLIDQSTSTVPIGLTWMDTGLTLVLKKSEVTEVRKHTKAELVELIAYEA